MGIAFFVTDLGVLNVLNGALSVSGFIALGPALVGLKLLDNPNKPAMYSLLIFGTIMTIGGLIYKENYVDDLKGSCIF